jgi:hypothetical protein
MSLFIKYSRRPPRPRPSAAADEDSNYQSGQAKLRGLFDEFGAVSAARIAHEALERRLLNAPEERAYLWRGLVFGCGEIIRERDTQGRRIRVMLQEKDDQGKRISQRVDRSSYEQLCLAIQEHLDDVDANVVQIGQDLDDVWQRFHRCSGELVDRFVGVGGARREHWQITDR